MSSELKNDQGKGLVLLNQVQRHGLWMGRLAKGVDLLAGLQDVCREQSIVLGQVEAIGAVQGARIGYYDQQAQEYNFLELKKGLEITSLLGNISLKDGQPMVHAHITLADERGQVFGGHLALGTIVYACEFVISKFEGLGLVRELDEGTGLPLWPACQGL